MELPYCSWRRESLRRQLPVLQLAVVLDVASQDMDVVQFGVELEESVFFAVCVWWGAGGLTSGISGGCV